MDPDRKRAYRTLLYRAMLDIRPIGWMPLGFFRLMNPFLWRQSVAQIRRAGAIANWLHNLALFAAHGFEEFNEETFWRELDQLNHQHPEYGLGQYRKFFDEALKEVRSGRMKDEG